MGRGTYATHSSTSTGALNNTVLINPQAYAKEYIRMSLMGVKNINELRECTKALPKGDKPMPEDPKPSSSTSSSTPSYSTSVVYQTSTYTITSCPPEKTNCPYRSHTIVLVPISTTTYEVKPTTEVHDRAKAHGHSHTNTTRVALTAPTTNATSTPVTAGAGYISVSLYAAAAVAGLLFASLI